MKYALYHRKTGKEAQVGDEVTSFSGEKGKIRDVQSPYLWPKHEGSTGRIDVGEAITYYPGVYDCEWRKVEE